MDEKTWSEKIEELEDRAHDLEERVKALEGVLVGVQEGITLLKRYAGV